MGSSLWRCVQIPLPVDERVETVHELDLFCACGEAIRFVGTDSDVRERAEKWRADHAVSRGHRMVTEAEFVALRDRFREAMGWGRRRSVRRRARQCAA